MHQLFLMVISEREDRENGEEKVFKEIMVENLPNSPSQNSNVHPRS